MTDRLALLERAFHRECRSLTQYLAESGLWERRDDRAARELVHLIMADERRWAGKLSELIEERRGVPRLGSYPVEFTNMNLHFVGLDFTLGKLAEFLERETAAIRADVAAAGDDSSVRSLLELMLERKCGQIVALRELAGSLAAKKSL